MSSPQQTKTPLPPFNPPKTNETRACEECGTHFTPEAWEIETPPKRAWLCGNDCLFAHICKRVDAQMAVAPVPPKTDE